MSTYAQHSLAFIELPLNDLGDPNTLKDFLEVQLNFQPGSSGSYWLEGENELGYRSGTTLRAPKVVDVKHNSPKTFLNLKGRSVKIRIWIITDNYNPWVLRDISVGWLVGVEN
jgi:hypothetical protein